MASRLWKGLSGIISIAAATRLTENQQNNRVDDMKLRGKTAIITGGSRDIGAAIARRFADEGADVALTHAGNARATGRTVAAIGEAGQKGVAIQADASDPEAAAQALGQAISVLGALDIIVHSAGRSEFVALADASPAEYLDAYQRHFATNIGGIIAMTSAAIPHMRDGGQIIGSVSARQMPFAGTATYAASKAAAAGLARGRARDLGPRGIQSGSTSVRVPGGSGAQKWPGRG